MIDIVRPILMHIPRTVFTFQELQHLFPQQSKGSLYGLIHRALQQQKLIQLRRGFYVLASCYRKKALNLHEIAYQLYGPSYISFESALAYHGLIPEAVHSVTSGTLKRAKDFASAVGNFFYYQLPVVNFYNNVERIATADNEVFFMASIWRALLDMEYIFGRGWHTKEDICEDLRIEKDDLPQFLPAQGQVFLQYYPRIHLKKFIKQLRTEQ